MMRTEIKSAWGFLGMACLAFVSLGLKLLLAFGIEPLIYGAGMNEWNTTQNILHWIFTCVVWVIVGILLLLGSKKMGYDPLSEKNH